MDTTQRTAYAITAWSDGYGRWHAKVTFPHGAGNTGEGERLIRNGMDAAKRTIRRELVEREAPHEVRRLIYTVTDNKSFGSGALYSITIAEDWDAMDAQDRKNGVTD